MCIYRCIRACVRSCACVYAHLNICVNIHRYICIHKTHTHTELCNHRATLKHAKKTKGFCPLGGADSSLQRGAGASTALGAGAPLFSASHTHAPTVVFVGDLASQRGAADCAGLSPKLSSVNPEPASLSPFWEVWRRSVGVAQYTRTHTHTHTDGRTRGGRGAMRHHSPQGLN